MACWRFQRKTARDIRREDDVLNGHERPFEPSFNSFAEKEENSRANDGVLIGRLHPSELLFHTIDQKNKITYQKTVF